MSTPATLPSPEVASTAPLDPRIWCDEDYEVEETQMTTNKDKKVYVSLQYEGSSAVSTIALFVPYKFCKFKGSSTVYMVAGAFLKVDADGPEKNDPRALKENDSLWGKFLVTNAKIGRVDPATNPGLHGEDTHSFNGYVWIHSLDMHTAKGATGSLWDRAVEQITGQSHVGMSIFTFRGNRPSRYKMQLSGSSGEACTNGLKVKLVRISFEVAGLAEWASDVLGRAVRATCPVFTASPTMPGKRASIVIPEVNGGVVDIHGFIITSHWKDAKTDTKLTQLSHFQTVRYGHGGRRTEVPQMTNLRRTWVIDHPMHRVRPAGKPAPSITSGPLTVEEFDLWSINMPTTLSDGTEMGQSTMMLCSFDIKIVSATAAQMSQVDLRGTCDHKDVIAYGPFSPEARAQSFDRVYERVMKPVKGMGGAAGVELKEDIPFTGMEDEDRPIYSTESGRNFEAVKRAFNMPLVPEPYDGVPKHVSDITCEGDLLLALRIEQAEDPGEMTDGSDYYSLYLVQGVALILRGRYAIRLEDGAVMAGFALAGYYVAGRNKVDDPKDFNKESFAEKGLFNIYEAGDSFLFSPRRLLGQKIWEDAHKNAPGGLLWVEVKLDQGDKKQTAAIEHIDNLYQKAMASLPPKNTVKVFYVVFLGHPSRPGYYARRYRLSTVQCFTTAQVAAPRAPAENREQYTATAFPDMKKVLTKARRFEAFRGVREATIRDKAKSEAMDIEQGKIAKRGAGPQVEAELGARKKRRDAAQQTKLDERKEQLEYDKQQRKREEEIEKNVELKKEEEEEERLREKRQDYEEKLEEEAAAQRQKDLRDSEEKQRLKHVADDEERMRRGEKLEIQRQQHLLAEATEQLARERQAEAKRKQEQAEEEEERKARERQAEARRKQEQAEEEEERKARERRAEAKRKQEQIDEEEERRAKNRKEEEQRREKERIEEKKRNEKAQQADEKRQEEHRQTLETLQATFQKMTEDLAKQRGMESATEDVAMRKVHTDSAADLEQKLATLKLQIEFNQQKTDTASRALEGVVRDKTMGVAEGVDVVADSLAEESNFTRAVVGDETARLSKAIAKTAEKTNALEGVIRDQSHRAENRQHREQTELQDVVHRDTAAVEKDVQREAAVTRDAVFGTGKEVAKDLRHMAELVQRDQKQTDEKLERIPETLVNALKQQVAESEAKAAKDRAEEAKTEAKEAEVDAKDATGKLRAARSRLKFTRDKRDRAELLARIDQLSAKIGASSKRATELKKAEEEGRKKALDEAAQKTLQTMAEKIADGQKPPVVVIGGEGRPPTEPSGPDPEEAEPKPNLGPHATAINFPAHTEATHPSYVGLKIEGAEAEGAGVIPVGELPGLVDSLKKLGPGAEVAFIVTLPKEASRASGTKKPPSAVVRGVIEIVVHDSTVTEQALGSTGVLVKVIPTEVTATHAPDQSIVTAHFLPIKYKDTVPIVYWLAIRDDMKNANVILTSWTKTSMDVHRDLGPLNNDPTTRLQQYAVSQLVVDDSYTRVRDADGTLQVKFNLSVDGTENYGGLYFPPGTKREKENLNRAHQGTKQAHGWTSPEERIQQLRNLRVGSGGNPAFQTTQQRDPRGPSTAPSKPRATKPPRSSWPYPGAYPPAYPTPYPTGPAYRAPPSTPYAASGRDVYDDVLGFYHGE